MAVGTPDSKVGGIGWWSDAPCPDFFNGSRRGYSGPLDFILSGLVEDISSEGWQNMKSNGHVMTILRSEMWYSSSKIEEYGVARPIWLESEYSD